ncbi:MAG: SgcJ/EcaC family oxidoreductase [Isosphaeraceae bacterium]|nr:SgcJ/EcaC family oxidoreductase [Isosphaeraceae bacterium]
MRIAVLTLTSLLGAGVCLSLGAPEEPKPAEPATAEVKKAIRKVVEDFTKAYNAADAKAIAELFAEDARVVLEDGRTLEGRAAIAAQFADVFDQAPGSQIEIDTESIRLVGPDSAIEEGIARIIPHGGGAPELSPYTVVYARRNGRWLQVSVREHPPKAVSNYERLKELEWMVGDWVNESGAAVVESTCRWAENKNFLLREFTVKVRGRSALTGSQRIGWDPLTKQIRSWVFDSEGAYSEGLWSRDGNRWLVKATGVLRDGQTASATHVITFVNKDTSTWQSIDRTIGGAVLPGIDEFTLVRKPPAPQRNPQAK